MVEDEFCRFSPQLDWQTRKPVHVLDSSEKSRGIHVLHLQVNSLTNCDVSDPCFVKKLYMSGRMWQLTDLYFLGVESGSDPVSGSFSA